MKYRNLKMSCSVFRLFKTVCKLLHYRVPTTMIDEIQKLKARLEAVEEEIKDTEERIPAHSAKPAVMTDVFRLEDEKALLIQQIKALQ